MITSFRNKNKHLGIDFFVTLTAISVFLCLSSRPVCAQPDPDELLKEAKLEYSEVRPPELLSLPILDKVEEYKDDLYNRFGTSVATALVYANQVLLASKHNNGKDRSVGWFKIKINQDIWRGGKIELKLRGGSCGNGIDSLAPSFSKFNKGAGRPATIYVSKLYLKQALFDDKVYLGAGRISASHLFDRNVVANSAEKQFLSRALVHNLTIPFPSSGLGIEARIKPLDWAYMSFGWANADSESTMIRMRNPFYNSFCITELGITPKIYDLQGNYRFIYRWNRENLDRIDGYGIQKGDQGFALSFDQQLTKKINVFFRYGITDEKVRPIQNFWSMGGEVAGLIPGRELDVVAIGLAQSIAGHDYSEAYEHVSPETMIEMYYKIMVSEYLFVTPDLQILSNPDMDRKQKTAVAIGVKALLLF